MKLYYTKNLNPRLCVAAVRHIGAEVAFVRAAPRHPRHEAAFQTMNPNGLAPVLQYQGGFLWETDAIVCHLSEVVGSDFWRRGAGHVEMIRWISWATHHLNSAAGPIYFDRIVRPTFTRTRAPEAEIAEAMRDWRQWMAVLDGHLSGRDWVADGALSYADFRVGAALPFAEAAALPLHDYPTVTAWHGRLMQLEAWRDPFAGLDDTAPI